MSSRPSSRRRRRPRASAERDGGLRASAHAAAARTADATGGIGTPRGRGADGGARPKNERTPDKVEGVVDVCGLGSDASEPSGFEEARAAGDEGGGA